MIEITKPTLVVDEAKVKRNLEKLAKKCKNDKVCFRPHFKTHQSIEIGRIFRELGVSKITVSSVSMANYFAQDDWDDITIAIPINIREVDEINELAKKISLGIVIESQESLDALLDRLPASTSLQVWLEIDTGSGRTGFYYEDYHTIEQLALQIQKQDNLNLQGILTHAGHTYLARRPQEIVQMYQESVFHMNNVKDHLQATGIENVKISVGDTPSCSVIKTFGDIDEARPGNFVFYDLKQEQLRSCSLDQIAIAVACPIISKHYNRKEIVIYGGTVHLSKESLDFTGIPIYGRIALPDPTSKLKWGRILNNVFVRATSQEHGIIKCEDTEIFDSLQIGDVVFVLPIHSCITANLYETYLTTDGRIWSSFRSL